MPHAATEPEELQANIVSRLNKIEGQIRGVSRMVQNGKQCQDVLVQIKAAKAALSSMNALVVKHYLHTCCQEIEQGASSEEKHQKIEEISSVLSNFVDK